MNRLKERRLELGLTQEAVSGILKMADPRMDVSMVSRFENGVCLPTEEIMTALEAALRASRAYLFGEEEKAELPVRTAETERIAYLIPKGRRNAISREDLAAALHTTDRKMRKAVAEAKTQAVEITNMEELVRWCMDNGYDGKVTYAAPTVSKSDIAPLLKAGVAVSGAEIVERMNMGVK